MNSTKSTASPLIPVCLSQNKRQSTAKTDAARHSSLQNAYFGINITEICVSNIVPNRYQPRKAFDLNSLARLSDSIRRHGLLQPITVRYRPDEQTMDPSQATYEIVCGERRYRAACMAGLERVKCIIVDSDDMVAAELSVIENLMREDLNIFEQAQAFDLLISTFNLTQNEVATRLSLSQSAIANKLRLLRLTETERALILEYCLTERHARALLKLSDSKIRLKFIHLIARDKLNVSSTEQLIDNYIKYTSRTPQTAQDTSTLAERHHNMLGIFKDVKVFSNSIEKAADILRKSGIFVETVCDDKADSYVYTITISKSANVSRET